MNANDLIKILQNLPKEDRNLEVMVLDGEMCIYWDVSGVRPIEDVVCPSVSNRRQKKEKFLLIE